MIQAASRKAIVDLRQQVAVVLDGPAASGLDRAALADELYSVAALLGSQPRLRRLLGDASTAPAGRAELSRGLLRGKISAATLDIVAAAVGQRWSSPWDLADSLEICADDASLSAAQQTGQLDEVEDELFRFERILANAGELSTALDEAGMSAERRIALASSLLRGKVNPITLSLVSHAIASDRKRRLEGAIQDLLEASATRRERSVARVISARELTAAQSTRLAAALGRIYGREISIRSAVDPEVQGGLVVRVGDEVIDGTVSSRLAAARAALAG